MNKYIDIIKDDLNLGSCSLEEFTEQANMLEDKMSDYLFVDNVSNKDILSNLKDWIKLYLTESKKKILLESLEETKRYIFDNKDRVQSFQFSVGYSFEFKIFCRYISVMRIVFTENYLDKESLEYLLIKDAYTQINMVDFNADEVISILDQQPERLDRALKLLDQVTDDTPIKKLDGLKIVILLSAQDIVRPILDYVIEKDENE